MNQSSNTIDARIPPASQNPPMGQLPRSENGPAVENVSSRWKVSSRIARLLTEDRSRQPSGTDVWNSRSSDVPQREKISSASTKISGGLYDAGRKPLAADDRIPAWLISMIVHMMLVLLLALFTVPASNAGLTNRITVQWKQTQAEGLATLATLPSIEPAQVADSNASVPAASEQASASVDLVDLALETEMPVASPRSVDRNDQVGPSIESVLGFSPEVSLETSFNGGRLGDRSEAGRAAAVESGATTGEAEDAMELALRWLAQHQHNDGGWSFRLNDEHGPCNGQCDNPVINTSDTPVPRTAATGLAMLAFMGAGHTHRSGKYAENIRRGIYYLRSQARETTLGIDLQNGSMYGHGIATLALAEAYVLTSDPDLRDIVAGTTFLCSGAQHGSGGWGYLPGGPPDITLTAWQVIALKTAEQRGIAIPTKVFPDAKSYLATLVDKLGVRYGYKTPEPKLSTTAIGILLQLYFGMLPGQTEIREGLDWIAEEGPSPTNVYYNYYAMLAMHHSRHEGNMDFAKKLRAHLLSTQSQQGHERGSWHFPDQYGSVGGRLYTTAMCALILQTPYRYVPLYDR